MGTIASRETENEPNNFFERRETAQALRGSGPGRRRSTTSDLVRTQQSHVGLDSQCYTYLIDAMAGLDEPTDTLAEQRIALFRTFLYSDNGLFILPTVLTEYKRIRNRSRIAFHEEWTTLFGETQPIDPMRVEARSAQFLSIHDDPDDCRILAEAEDARLGTLLSFDSKFIAHLTGASPIRLLRPLEYWQSLNIPRGAKPCTLPRSDNPMASQTWWRWI